jgi:hypothetical protein
VCAAPAARAFAQADPNTVDDSTRATARQLGAEGLEAFWSQDFVNAAEKLERAYRLMATPTLGLWSARTRAQLGHLVEAAERYREAARASETVGDAARQKKARHEATSELSELMPRIPTLAVRIENASPDEVSLRVDEVSLSSAVIDANRPLNPGTHHVVAARGDERYEMDVSLVEGQHESRVFKFRTAAALEPVAAHAGPVVTVASSLEPKPVSILPSSQPSAAEPAVPYVPIAVSALALGGVGFITAGITAGMALSRCPRGDCDGARSLESYQTLHTVSAVSFYAGVAFAAGSLITWWLAPKSERAAGDVAFDIGPGRVMLKGAF